MAEPRIRYAKTKDGVNIAFAVVGEGPTVVVLPSVFSDIRRLRSGVGRGSLGALAAAGRRAGRRVVSFDGRSTGSSDRGVPCTLEGRVADLEAVVGELALERFDLGGAVHAAAPAMAYAARHPESVAHLVLANPYATGKDYYSRTPTTRAIKALTTVAEDAWEFVTLALANALLDFNDSDSARRLAAEWRDSMTASDYVNLVEEAFRTDIRPDLGRVMAPTLVIEDRSQFGAALELAKPIASQIKGAEYVVVNGTEEVGQAVETFLGPVAAPEAARRAGGDSALVAILWTDLVGHSEMMSRLGDERGREVLREHERITREVLKAHGGTEVKTMGDGFMASLGSVTKAVECAMALQRAFAEREGEPLSVRVGLNAGEPIEEEGDLFGATVILASRIAAKAEGGEILVADTVRGLCSGKGFLFSDRGEFVAKGFEEPVRVYEVRWRDA
jgi:class 3 adenylate cyclase